MSTAREEGRRGLPGPAKLGVEKLHVEGGVVDHQPRIADEIGEVGGYRLEDGFVGEKLGRQSVHRDRLLGDVALRVDIDVERAAGRHVVEELDGADLDDPVAGIGIEAGRLGVEHDFTHVLSLPSARASNVRTSARAASSAAVRLDDEIGALPLFGIRHLAVKHPRERGLGHARSRQDPRPLHRRRGGDDQHPVEPSVGAGLVEQRDVEEQDVGVTMRGGKGGAILGDERVDRRLRSLRAARDRQ